MGDPLRLWRDVTAERVDEALENMREQQAEFRAAGLTWLSTHSSDCDEAGPGPGPGGGTRIGH